jgi:uncharacterized protein YjbI with pentapeptide repeats
MLSLALAVAALVATAPSAGAAVVNGCNIAPATSCPGADLSGANLSGADLQGANLRGANLSRANLDDANLHGADLRDANLHFVFARRANLSSVPLTGATMTVAQVQSANFHGSQLDHAHLGFLNATGATMTATNFAGSKLHFATLDRANLLGANFHGAILHFTFMLGADVRNSNFAHANFGNTFLNGAKTSGANLWPSNLESDSGAVHAFFERVRAHLDAYDGYGGCIVLDERPFSGQLLEDITCSAKAVPGGSYGFNGSANREISIFLSEIGGPSIRVRGTNGVSLDGSASENLGAWHVSDIKGLQAGPTGDRGVGQPGGPLAVDLRRNDYHEGLNRRRGYVMFIVGWLRRTE